MQQDGNLLLVSNISQLFFLSDSSCNTNYPYSTGATGAPGADGIPGDNGEDGDEGAEGEKGEMIVDSLKGSPNNN